MTSRFLQPFLYVVFFLSSAGARAETLQISSFKFPGIVAATYYDHESRKITVHVPHGTDRSKLEPEIVHSGTSIRRTDGGAVPGFPHLIGFEVSNAAGAKVTYTVQVVVHHWELINDAPGPAPRDGAGLLSFKGTLWLLGGWEAPLTTNQVWNSDDNGKSWRRLADAPWPPRHGAGWVVFKDRMWVISGDELADVWSSPDGLNWTQENASAPFGRRYTPYVVPFKDRLWVMGGMSWLSASGKSIWPSARAMDDVWSSEDGREWKLELEHAPWAARGMIHGYAVLRDRMFIMGGGTKNGIGADRGKDTTAEYNDVWYTVDGKDWIRSMDRAPWAPRTHFTVTSTPKYIYVTDGSVRSQQKLSNEVWRTQTGHDWEQLTPTPWNPRHASALTYHDGRLYLSTGFLVSDVWAMDSR